MRHRPTSVFFTDRYFHRATIQSPNRKISGVENTHPQHSLRPIFCHIPIRAYIIVTCHWTLAILAASSPYSSLLSSAWAPHAQNTTTTTAAVTRRTCTVTGAGRTQIAGSVALPATALLVCLLAYSLVPSVRWLLPNFSCKLPETPFLLFTIVSRYFHHAMKAAMHRLR